MFFHIPIIVCIHIPHFDIYWESHQFEATSLNRMPFLQPPVGESHMQYRPTYGHNKRNTKTTNYIKLPIQT